MTTSTINPGIPATGFPLASAPMRAQFQAAIADINALWIADAAGIAATATAQSTANTALANAAAATAAAAAATAAVAAASTGWTKVSTYGNPSGTNDTTTIQNAYTAAINSGRQLLFDIPIGWPSATVDWYLNNAPSDLNGSLSVPQVLVYDTSTGLVTFDRSHNLQTGDVISFAGSPGVGAGGGFTQVASYTEYFVNRQGSTTVILYDTKAHAVSGGATGKYIPTTGVTTTGVVNTVTTTTNIINTSTTVTVTDASKLIVGDQLNFVGQGGGTYYTITNIATNDLTFTPAYSGSTITAGAILWPTSVEVASVLSLELGSTFSFSGPGTANNFFGSFVVTSISGTTIHMSFPPNNALPTPGATQTFRLGLWGNPAYFNIKFEMAGTPGVIVKKTAGFSGNEMFHWFYGSNVYIHDLEIWGRTYGYTALADPNIVNGDDGIRVLSGNNTRIERLIAKNFGDSALRFNTSTFWVGAKSTTFPNAGIYSNNIFVKDSYFLDNFQLSTTASGANYQGGTHNVFMTNNTFEGIGGSIKFANRAPGGANIYFTNNIVSKVGRHALELDSYNNLFIQGNTIENCKNFGIYIIANDLQPIGFEFNTLTIKDNIISGGVLTTASSSSGGILINPDLYPDGTRWDFKGLNISGNVIKDMPAATYPVNIASGSYQGSIIANNNINNCAGTVTFRMTPRCSATTGLNNNMLITGNVVTKTSGTKCTFVDLVPSNGAAGVYFRGVTLSNNMFDNSDASLGSNASNDSYFFHGDYVQDTHILNNWWRGYGSTAVYIQNEGDSLTIQGNDFFNSNTAAGSVLVITKVNGLRINDNRLGNSFSGTGAINIDRQCQAVRMFGNDLTGSTNATISVSNVPIKTSQDGQRRIDYLAAATTPTAGTWNIGDQAWTTTPSSGAAPGGVCTVAGSYSAITATASSDGSTAVLTSLSNFTNLAVGTYFTHAGFTGTVRIISMTATTITVSANSTSIQAAQAITVAAATFKAMANLA